MSVQERLRYVDVAKGVGILLVVLGHSRFADDGYWGCWVNSFHMPLFFVLAGYCFDEGKYPTYWDYVKRKVLALGYPYVMLSVFTALMMTLFYIPHTLRYLKMLAQGGWEPSGFWFIRVLIAVELLYAGYGRIFRGKGIMLEVGLLIAACISAYRCFYFLEIGRMNTIFVSLLFYHIGKLCRPWHSVEFRALYLAVGSLTMFVVLSLLVWFFVPVRAGYGGCYLGNPVVYLLTALSGTAFVVSGARALEDCRKMGMVVRGLAWLGKYSILLLAVHGGCGLCRHSWGTAFPILSGWPSQMLEIVLICILMWLLSGPLKFFMRLPKGGCEERTGDESK